MAYSYVQYVGNGSTVTFSVPFAYISKEHIEVRVNSVLKTVGIDYTWVSASAITFVTAPGSGLTVDIRRRSSPAARLVDFQDGSTLTQDILDADSNQNFFLAQESYDSADISLHKDTDGQWNAEGRRLKNVGTPVDPTDALTKATVDAIYPSVNSVATNLDNVQKVAADLSSNFGYQTDLGSITSPVTVPPGQTSRIQTVAENIVAVETVADNITAVQGAITSAASAATSATNAANSASTATTKASEASTSAYNAFVSAGQASGSASQALAYSTNAANSATNAGASATLANDWAVKTGSPVANGEYSAKYHAQNAANSASTAVTNAGAATSAASSVAANAASASASAAGAASSASNAATSATNAAASASSALSSKDSATASAASAATSAANALSSKDNAATSATNAATSEANALSYKNSAATSASNAAASAASAATDAGIAANVATNSAVSIIASDLAGMGFAYDLGSVASPASNVSNSPPGHIVTVANNISAVNAAYTNATNAATSASLAAAAQIAAEQARDQTLAAYDNFDDRYLGTKSSDPTVDNDGNALVGGSLYFNSTSGVMKVYTGTAWVAAYASLSGALLVANNLSDLASASTARTNLGLSTVAATGSYSDLSGKPTLGSLAALNSVGTAYIDNASVTAAKLASTLDLGSI